MDEIAFFTRSEHECGLYLVGKFLLMGQIYKAITIFVICAERQQKN